MPCVTVRPTMASDVPAMKAVIDATGLFPSDMLDAMLDGYLAGRAPPECWLSGITDGRAVALAYYCPERMTEGTWNLLLIAVHPDRHGEGIGRALMRHVESDLAWRGERLLVVETSGLPDYERTRRFYRGLGYSEEARIRDFYQHGEDKVIFRKLIPAKPHGPNT